ncbi:MAG: Txe/YoeB family addiction module toxin [Clostridiales bacterium]|jgi:Txe/YoeB family toxin of toxin-antitoxin system|nr:Txe/YoeB family addiction module toxin [Clostridiales bacterium]
MKYQIKFEKQAEKDFERIEKSPYKNKVLNLLEKISVNPYEPPAERLVGEYLGLYSLRINQQHRLVYKVVDDKYIVIVLAMWTHYKNI